MKNSTCFCSIIPPHILDELKKHPELHIKKSADELDTRFRLRRAKRIIDFGRQPFAIQNGSAKRFVYDCNNGTDLRLDLKRKEGDVAASDPVVNVVYDNAGYIRDFFKTQLDFNSVDNHGADLILNIHFADEYNNAYWDGDEMVFGDGDTVIFINLANSLDVTGHELTHGVVQYTGGLIYEGQSGALNEHMADVFGVTIRQVKEGQTANPASANWMVGDTIMGPSLVGQAIRNMKNPGTAYDNLYMGKDPQPAHMDNYYTGSDDNYGVHINSGIPNKVFYLVSVGLNDTLKAAMLWFTILKSMRPNENFRSFKRKAMSRARRLAFQGKLPYGTRKLVKEAFNSVGI